MPVCVSQQAIAPAESGQELAHWLSLWQLEMHTFAGGGGVDVFAGGTVCAGAGAGSVGATSCAAGSSDPAQATMRTVAVTRPRVVVLSNFTGKSL